MIILKIFYWIITVIFILALTLKTIDFVKIARVEKIFKRRIKDGNIYIWCNDRDYVASVFVGSLPCIELIIPSMILTFGKSNIIALAIAERYVDEVKNIADKYE